MSESAEFAAALTEFGAQKPDDLYAAIGYGKLQPKQVFVKLVPDDKLREKPPEGAVASVVRRVLGTGEEKIKVRGFDDLHGVPGALLQSDPRREDRRLHHARQGCLGPLRHVPERRQPPLRSGRRIEVEWDTGRRRGARYTVKLTMEVEDRKGLLAAVSARIADLNTNIKNMEARTDHDSRARLDMTVEISDLKHLEKVIKSLRGRRGCAGGRKSGAGGSGR